MKIELTKQFIQMNPGNPLLAYLKTRLPPRTKIEVGFATCTISGVSYKYSKPLRQWWNRVLSGKKMKPIVCFIRENR